MINKHKIAISILAAFLVSNFSEAATPTACKLSQLTGTWSGFKTNITASQSSQCTMNVNSKGKITGSCFDEQYSYTSESYPISSGSFYLGKDNSCVLSFDLSLAGGTVLVKGNGGLTPEKTSIQGYFSNNQGGFGPINFVKIPSPKVAVTPSGGLWKGDKIQFNVASDGSKITNAGSALYTQDGYQSSMIVNFPVSGCGASSVSVALMMDIPITNEKFNYDGGASHVTGTFSSATTATGTYSHSYYDSYNHCTITGSGNWTAQR